MREHVGRGDDGPARHHALAGQPGEVFEFHPLQCAAHVPVGDDPFEVSTPVHDVDGSEAPAADRPHGFEERGRYGDGRVLLAPVHQV